MNEKPTKQNPFTGVRIIDCTQVLAGPFATQILADLGAEIIKIESPGIGDISRSTEPTIGDSQISAYFASLNRGKKSIELDLSEEEGKRTFKKLVEDSDVVIENFRPGTMDSWGLGFDKLREINNEIIYCSIKGFLDGPYRDMPAFDMVVQALSGAMSVTGESDGQPLRPGIPIGDICAGMYAVIGIVTGLYNRESNGAQFIEVPMFEGLVSWLTTRAGRTFATGEPYPRMGNSHPSFAPYDSFQTKDGWITLSIASQGTWKTFCQAIDRPDLLQNQLFESNPARVRNREALYSILEPVFLQKPSDEWFDLFLERGIPGAPVKNTVDVFQDQQIIESGLTTDLTLGGIDLPFVQLPIRFSGFSTGTESKPPRLGEHTQEILDSIDEKDRRDS